jgi:hypothetical protein
MIEKSKKHLKLVSESYVQHMAFAFKYGATCILAGLMAFVHGLVPAFFESAASERIKKLSSVHRKDENSP